MRWAAILAAITLACVLAVIGASASIRLTTKLEPNPAAERIQAARAVRQNVGGAAALGVLGLAVATNAVRATRAALGPASLAALALTLLLSAVGFATGTEPPRAAAFVNQFGGVLLAGVLGWIAGCAVARGHNAPLLRRLASVALAACLLQAAFGGAVTTLLERAPASLLVLHAATGLATAAVVLALAREVRLSAQGTVLVACAAASPLAGVVATLQAPSSALPQSLHALVGAALLAAVSYARAALAPPVTQ